MRKQFIFIAVFFLSIPILIDHVSGQGEDLSVLKNWMKYTDAPNAFYMHLTSQAFDHLNRRSLKIAQLNTKKDWIHRQRQIREALLSVVGPFPLKSPLNAKVLSIVNKNGYRIEKIIYESIPNFFVTACLFVPDGLKGRNPAILFCSGHSVAAFRRPLYQQVVLNLVRKGFIVLAFDPIGQGERLQYYDTKIGDSRIGGPTKEHSYPGAQCFISGVSVARYFIWDGIRGIDYLLSRPEVDPERIGCHGLSGGGTQSSYIAAFDERVKAVAPTGYITSFLRLLESIGPQDAEQNFYNGIASGIDHADLLEVRAPKPALIVATTRDFFSIQGSRETFQEIKRVYSIFGKKQNIEISEDDYVHGYTKKNREAIYGFFQKHLNLAGDPSEEEVEFLSPEDLQVTSTGQISTDMKVETIFSINKAATQHLLDDLEKSRQNLGSHLEHVKKSAKRLSGFIQPDPSPGEVVFTGRYQRDGYSIEKYFIQGEENYVIPFLLMIPEETGIHPATVYLHPVSKSEEAGPGETIEWFVKQGHVVLAPDLIGIGEMGPGIFRGDAYEFKVGRASYNLWFTGIQISRSLVGIRAGDVIRLVYYLKSRGDVNAEKISGIALGDVCPVLLHASAFEPSISKIALIEPFISYRSIVMNQYYQPKFILSTVPGALTAYDLPDLAACLAPRKLFMINTTDQNGNRAGAQQLESELSVINSAYSIKSVLANLMIGNWEPYETIDKVFSSWIQ